MDLHEGNYRELTIPNQRPDRETGKRRDLVAAVSGNLRTEGYPWCACLGGCCGAEANLVLSEAGRSS